MAVGGGSSGGSAIKPKPAKKPKPAQALVPKTPSLETEDFTEDGHDEAMAARPIVQAIGKVVSKAPKKPKPAPKLSAKKIEETAERISDGHAYEKHKKALGVKDKAELKERVKKIMTAPDDSLKLHKKASAYWDEKTKNIVVRNPKDPDKGTIYKSRKGSFYQLLNQKRR